MPLHEYDFSLLSLCTIYVYNLIIHWNVEENRMPRCSYQWCSNFLVGWVLWCNYIFTWSCDSHTCDISTQKCILSVLWVQALMLFPPFLFLCFFAFFYFQILNLESIFPFYHMVWMAESFLSNVEISRYVTSFSHYYSLTSS